MHFHTTTTTQLVTTGLVILLILAIHYVLLNWFWSTLCPNPKALIGGSQTRPTEIWLCWKSKVASFVFPPRADWKESSWLKRRCAHHFMLSPKVELVCPFARWISYSFSFFRHFVAERVDIYYRLYAIKKWPTYVIWDHSCLLNRIFTDYLMPFVIQ